VLLPRNIGRQDLIMPVSSQVPVPLRPNRSHVAHAKFSYRNPATEILACAMLLKRPASAAPESLCKSHILARMPVQGVSVSEMFRHADDLNCVST
jgi:hypothetical protein